MQKDECRMRNRTRRDNDALCRAPVDHRWFELSGSRNLLLHSAFVILHSAFLHPLGYIASPIAVVIAGEPQSPRTSRSHSARSDGETGVAGMPRTVPRWSARPGIVAPPPARRRLPAVAAGSLCGAYDDDTR